MQNGFTALMHAASKSHNDTLRLLLVAPGVDVNAKDTEVSVR